MAAHLVRDVGTGEVTLLWPVSSAGLSLPFWVEATLLGALATRAWARARALPQVTEQRLPRSVGPGSCAARGLAGS